MFLLVAGFLKALQNFDSVYCSCGSSSATLEMISSNQLLVSAEDVAMLLNLDSPTKGNYGISFKELSSIQRLRIRGQTEKVFTLKIQS